MTTPSEEEARAAFGVHITRGALSDGVHAYDTRDEGAPGMIDAFDAQLRSHVSGSGFAQREAMALKAWEFYTTRETAMTHDFRDGYHQGFIDGLASRVSTPPSEDWEYGEQNSLDGVWRVEPDHEPALWARVPAERRVRRRKAGLWEPLPAVPVLPTEPADDHSDHARCGDCAEWPTTAAPTEPEEKP